MYGVGGEHRLTEVELPWLPGYEESRPVRIGNGAYDQFQLDAYGQVIHTLYDALSRGLPHHPGEADQILVLVDFVEKNWQRTDEGIWEVRGPNARHFTHSKVMAWVAVDRAIRLFEEFKVGANHKIETRIQRWRALREEIRNDILARAFNRRRNAFVQYYDSEDLDASVLLIPHTGFLRADDPRMLSTVAAIEKELTWDGLVLRYATENAKDGLPGPRSHVPHLQLLARRQLRDVGSARRRGGAARPPRLALELAGPPGRGVSPRAAPPARQLPAGVLAHRAHQHRAHHRRGPSRPLHVEVVRLAAQRPRAPIPRRAPPSQTATPQRPVNDSPGASMRSPSPLLNAFGAQLIGSTATPWRRRARSGKGVAGEDLYEVEGPVLPDADLVGAVAQEDLRQALPVPLEVGERVIELRRADDARTPKIDLAALDRTSCPWNRAGVHLQPLVRRARTAPPRRRSSRPIRNRDARPRRMGTARCRRWWR